jgi:hypothetical protein
MSAFVILALKTVLWFWALSVGVFLLAALAVVIAEARQR